MWLSQGDVRGSLWEGQHLIAVYTLWPAQCLAPGGPNTLVTCPKYQPMSTLLHLLLPMPCIHLSDVSCYLRHFLKHHICSSGQPSGVGKANMVIPILEMRNLESREGK